MSFAHFSKFIVYLTPFYIFALIFGITQNIVTLCYPLQLRNTKECSHKNYGEGVSDQLCDCSAPMIIHA